MYGNKSSKETGRKKEDCSEEENRSKETGCKEESSKETGREEESSKEACCKESCKEVCLKKISNHPLLLHIELHETMHAAQCAGGLIPCLIP